MRFHGKEWIEEQLSYIRSIRGSVANFSVGRSRERDGRETGTGWGLLADDHDENHGSGSHVTWQNPTFGQERGGHRAKHRSNSFCSALESGANVDGYRANEPTRDSWWFTRDQAIYSWSNNRF